MKCGLGQKIQVLGGTPNPAKNPKYPSTWNLGFKSQLGNQKIPSKRKS